jgi:hypothetical protein
MMQVKNNKIKNNHQLKSNRFVPVYGNTGPADQASKKRDRSGADQGLHYTECRRNRRNDFQSRTCYK